MLRTKECREFAEKCRAMARSARNVMQKSQFLRLADQWDAFAESRKKLLRLKRKVKKLSTK
jgi:hypothetical protein